ncbi:twin-arginine translocation signal domain-containing protein [Hasllibacter sp. MH4015]|uniref:twin-arginine translocation signal domain-containing protein n=1 Tax=Hasllibacter sp. MH4015 TaxID=2854029 RepID=UPI001CD24FD9|nr:twin-arginine translocation signal domain-containing protein [Hasllibacter sp. MH4015]
MSSDHKKKTLTDTDISTDRAKAQTSGRRGFMGLMAAGGVAGAAATLTPREASAQGTDSDNGAWTDAGGCGRGSGGVSTGLVDADNGSGGTDAPGFGRGAPYC